MTGSRGLSGVNVSNDNDVNMILLLTAEKIVRKAKTAAQLQGLQSTAGIDKN
jgi:hypothetical protein